MIFTKVIEEGTERVMYAQMLDTNIFTNCGHCNTELEVNRETLRQILSSETSLEGVELFCNEHCKREFIKNNEDEIVDEEVEETESVEIEEKDSVDNLVAFIESLPLTDDEKVSLGDMIVQVFDDGSNTEDENSENANDSE